METNKIEAAYILEIRALIDKAQAYATKMHEGQFRWDRTTPYIKHPEYVASKCIGPAIVIAWLHDVVEDCYIGDRKVTLDDLRQEGFPEWVVTSVDAITKQDDEEYLTYLRRVKHDRLALEVKCEDILHNCDNNVRKNMRDKYLLALEFLRT